jgi:transcription factor IIIB subunit 2
VRARTRNGAASPSYTHNTRHPALKPPFAPPSLSPPLAAHTRRAGKYEINQIADRLGIRPREDVTGASLRLYKLAVSRNFTRGRRTAHVAGACLYLVCRQESRPYMLIDVSDALQANVYALGAVFLQLCRLLRLDEHPSVARPVDPSLYIHRFADRLELGRLASGVAHTALRLVASMKRDWLQTGRRPAGICGAALFVAAAVHGAPRSKEEVVAVVHVGVATLAKRLAEFEATPAGALTAEEFDARAIAAERAAEAALAALPAPGSAAALALAGALTCMHAGTPGAVAAAHGMCRVCYGHYAAISGGAAGGADPPAFARAEKARADALALRAAEAEADAAELAALEAGGGSGAPLALPAPDAPPLALPAPGEQDAGGVHADMEAALCDATLRRAMDMEHDAPPKGAQSKKKGGAKGGAQPAAKKARAAAAAASKGKGRATARGRGATDSSDSEEAEGDSSSEEEGEDAGAEGAARGGKGRKRAAPDEGGTAAVAARRRARLAAVDAAAAAAANASARAAGPAATPAATAPLAIVPVPPPPPPPAPRPLSLEQRAVAALRRLVGEEFANTLALPFSNGRARACLGAAHLGTAHPQYATPAVRCGAHVRAVAADELHFLLAARTFDASGIAFLARHAAHDVAGLAAAPPPPGVGDAAEQDKQTFSDIEDDDVDAYLHSAEEAQLKGVIWGELNREYLQTQAAREAAQACAEAVTAAAAAGGEGGGVDADGNALQREGGGAGAGAAAAAAAAAAAKAKPRRKRAPPSGPGAPAESAEEAARAMLASKKLSSKINYEALKGLFDDEDEGGEGGAEGGAQGARATPATPALDGGAAGGGGGGGAGGWGARSMLPPPSAGGMGTLSRAVLPPPSPLVSRRAAPSLTASGGLGSLRPAGTSLPRGSLTHGGPALTSGSLGHGLSALGGGALGGGARRVSFAGDTFGGGAPTMSGNTSIGTAGAFGARAAAVAGAGAAGGTSKPRPAPSSGWAD